MTCSILARGLEVTHAGLPLVTGVDLSVGPGEVVTLFGPSGAGKSTIAEAMAGVRRPGLRVSGDLRVPQRHPGFLPQHAAETLNPSRRIGTALSELLVIHGDPPRRRRERRAWLDRELRALLVRAGFPADDTHASLFLRRYPFEFSGGQRTRLALAQVLATRPELLVLDEPTNGLDEASRDVLIEILAALREEGRGLLLVTHDPVVETRLSDRTAYVEGGRLVDLPAQVPPAVTAVRRERAGAPGGPVLEVRGLDVRAGRSRLVQDIGFTVGHGEILGLVGRSGAGKSTIARAVAGLVPLHAGQVILDGSPLPRLGKRDRRQKAACQLVWQEAAASFVPWEDVLTQIARTARVLRGASAQSALLEATEVLDELGLTREMARRRPGELSGGQLRRAAIARAVLARPRVLVCDEVTTGLDRGMAGRILDFIDDHRRQTQAAVVLISHDLDLVGPRFDRVVELDRGRLVSPEPV